MRPTLAGNDAAELMEVIGRIGTRPRRELTFAMNYRTIVDYSLDAPGMLVLGDRPVRYCRLCERTSVHAPFSCCPACRDGNQSYVVVHGGGV